MKIAIATVQVPFTRGGAEIHAELLRDELRQRGHSVDIVTIPFKWYPPETLINCMLAGRMMDLSEVNGERIDLVIAMKFPAYYVKHPRKVVWLLHQHRQAYDLWGTKFGDLHHLEDGSFIRSMIVTNDNQYLREAVGVFTNAKNTAVRLKKYNNIDAMPLYHPPRNHEKLHCSEYGDFIFYPSRIDEMKRQRVLVEAARFLKTGCKILIAGSGSERELRHLEELIRKYNLQNKVKLLGYISEEEKIDHYARCRAVYFGAYDEDYGYITLEAFFSKKPVIVHPDAGGPLEFVEHGKNGHVVDAEPRAVAQAIDNLFRDRASAKELGDNGNAGLNSKKISWEHVITSLLEHPKR